MPAIDHSMVSSQERPIKLRTRADLVIQETVYLGERSWIVKDPVAMKYFRVQEPERIALDMIDGETSYEAIKDCLQRKFPEERIRIDDVHLLVNSFHNNGLLISNAPGQTAPLIVRRNKEQRLALIFVSITF